MGANLGAGGADQGDALEGRTEYCAALTARPRLFVMLMQ